MHLGEQEVHKKIVNNKRNLFTVHIINYSLQETNHTDSNSSATASV